MLNGHHTPSLEIIRRIDSANSRVGNSYWIWRIVVTTSVKKLPRRFEVISEIVAEPDAPAIILNEAETEDSIWYWKMEKKRSLPKKKILFVKKKHFLTYVQKKEVFLRRNIHLSCERLKLWLSKD